MRLRVISVVVALAVTLSSGCGGDDDPAMSLDVVESEDGPAGRGDAREPVGVDGPDGLVLGDGKEGDAVIPCSCGNRQCGYDNCGNSCGSCLSGQTCSPAGLCVDPPVQCTQTGFTAVEQTAEADSKENGGFFLHYQGISATAVPLDGVVVEIDGGSPLGGPTTPGTYDVKCKNLSTCGLRVYLIQGWNGQGYTKFFAPLQGTITIQSLSSQGGLFSGSLNGVVVKEAVVDQATQAVTFVDGGVTWCLDGYQMAANVQVKQGYCVAQGTGIMIGDNIKDFKLQNCNGETVGLHSLCGKGKAIWIVATAGW